MRPLQLLEALDWCLGLGITCVSVYAFSIENFRREPREVELLMRLAEQKLDELLQASPACHRPANQPPPSPTAGPQAGRPPCAPASPLSG